MLTDRWDIAHFCIAVPDLQQAMDHYKEVYGLSGWSSVVEFSDETYDVVSPMHGGPTSMVGSREVLAFDGAAAIAERPPFAPLELAHADRYSPGFSIYGCPDGQPYLHHIGFYVDDIESEADHLIETGYEVELTMAPGDRVRGFGYFIPKIGGPRIELITASLKDTVTRLLDTGQWDGMGLED